MSGMVNAIFTLSRAKDQHGPAIETFKSMWKNYMKVWDGRLGKQRYCAGGEVNHRRLRSLRRDRAHEGRAARPGRRLCERRALDRCDGRAPGGAEGDEVLNQPTTRAACWLWPSVIPRAFIQS